MTAAISPTRRSDPWSLAEPIQSISPARTATITRSTSTRRLAAGTPSATRERQRQTGGAAFPLAELVRAVGAHVDARRLEPPARLRVLRRDQRPPRRERERVAAERVEFLVGHLDGFDSALGQELHEPHGHQRG